MDKFTSLGLRRLRASSAERTALATGIQIALLTTGMLQMVWSDAWAQAIGELTGRITDSTGRLLGDLPVHVEEIPACDEVRAGHRQTCREWRTQSGYQGAFYAGQLPAGTYRVTIALGTFQPYEQVVRIQAGLNEFMDVVVQLRGEEEIRVEMPAPIVQPAPGAAVDLLGTTFTHKDIESSVLSSGRTLQTFQRLVPGAIFTDSVGTLAQFTVLGQRRFSNRLTIDGMSADLAADVRGTGAQEAASGALPAADVSGSSQAVVSLQAVDQIQVRTTNAPPELARSAGAQTSIVTRAGGDHFSGAALTTLRPDRLSGRTWFEKSGELPQRRSALWNGGLSIGGPLAPKGRLTAFATTDRQQVNRSVQTTINVPSAQVRNAAPSILRSILDAFPAPNGADIGGGLSEYSAEFPARSNLSAVSTRLDGRLSPSFRWFVRIHRAVSSGDQLTERNQMPFLSHVREEATSTTSATVAALHQWSDAVSTDTRANITRHEGQITAHPATGAAPFPLGLLGGAIDDAWVQLTLFPGPSGSIFAGRASGNVLRQVQFAEVVSVSAKTHDLRMGGDYSEVEVASLAAPYRYNYAFGNVEQFLRGQARLLTSQYARPWSATRKRWALFAQDRVRISSGVSLDYGLRYSATTAPESDVTPGLIDFEALPDVVMRAATAVAWRTAHRFAPSVQLAYQRDRTVLRAGFATVFDEQTSPGLAAFSDGYPFVTTSVSVSPTFPAKPDEVPTTTGPPLAAGDRANYYSIPRTFRPARVRQWSLGIDRALPLSNHVSLAYVGSAGRDLVGSYTQYGPPPTMSPVVYVYSNNAQASYHALLSRYSAASRNGLQIKVDYAWSRSIDTDSGEPTGPQPPPFIAPQALNRGPSDFDRPHVLQLTSSYTVPSLVSRSVLAKACSDWRIDAIATYISGGPFSVDVSMPYRLRLDVVEGVPQWLEDPAVLGGRRLSPSAFMIPGEARQGTLGRNALRAAPLRQVDLSLSRRFRIYATIAATLRVTAFNALNADAPGPPMRIATDSQFWQANRYLRGRPWRRQFGLRWSRSASPGRRATRHSC